MLPAFAMATAYPLAKRFLSWPQFALAPTVAWPVFVGWISATKAGESRSDESPMLAAVKLERLDLLICGPLFLAYAAWTICFDTAYGLQDILGDKVSGIGSLAQFLGRRFIKPFLSILNLFVSFLLGLAAERAHCSTFFWVFGIGLWAISVPFQLYILNPGVSRSGGKVFSFNIMLGLYVTFVTLMEVVVSPIAYEGQLPRL